MDRKEKEKSVEDLRDRLGKAQGLFLVDYQGLNVESLTVLRKELRDVDTEFQVVKNRLMKLASKDTASNILIDQMRGPTAIALTYEDVVKPAKVLVNFAKRFDKLSVKSGQISGTFLDNKAISRLAELPGREVLLAQTLAAMQAVPAGFVRVLNGVLVQLLNVLKAIEEKKENPA